MILSPKKQCLVQNKVFLKSASVILLDLYDQRHIVNKDCDACWDWTVDL